MIPTKKDVWKKDTLDSLDRLIEAAQAMREKIQSDENYVCEHGKLLAILADPWRQKG